MPEPPICLLCGKTTSDRDWVRPEHLEASDLVCSACKPNPKTKPTYNFPVQAAMQHGHLTECDIHGTVSSNVYWGCHECFKTDVDRASAMVEHWGQHKGCECQQCKDQLAYGRADVAKRSSAPPPEPPLPV